jgi:hypothetical protein
MHGLNRMRNYALRQNIALGRRLLSISAWLEAEGLARRYYYKLDDRGSLYLFNTKHMNVATALRDKAFLRQFFGSLRPKDPPKFALELGSSFPLVSLCGKEESFLEVLDDEGAVLCFTDLHEEDLLYGGELKEPFLPSNLLVGETGRLYHPILAHKHLGKKKGEKGNRPFVGLLHPHLADRLLKDSLRPIEAGGFDYNFRGEIHRIELIKPHKGRSRVGSL